MTSLTTDRYRPKITLKWWARQMADASLRLMWHWFLMFLIVYIFVRSAAPEFCNAMIAWLRAFPFF